MYFVIEAPYALYVSLLFIAAAFDLRALFFVLLTTLLLFFDLPSIAMNDLHQVIANCRLLLLWLTGAVVRRRECLCTQGGRSCTEAKQLFSE